MDPTKISAQTTIGKSIVAIVGSRQVKKGGDEAFLAEIIQGGKS